MSAMAQQPPYPPYGPPPPMPVRPTHREAITVLVLGIVGLAVCGVVGPVAWVMGNRVVREIDASGGALGGRSEAQVGRVLGIVSTAFLLLALVVGLGAVIAVLVGLATNSG
jgi:hypothetical protein